jgi:pyridoxine 5-phosphate synthase
VIRLSVNVNKVATLRNSRGGREPSVVDAVRSCVAAGAPGITVHPRADERHIRFSDVREVAAELAPLQNRIEYNIEGDPRADLIALVLELVPHQFTLVPVREGEVTSQAGWAPDTPRAELTSLIRELKAASIRVSVFVDAEPEPVRWAASLGADRVELFTEPFARAWERGARAAEESFARFAAAARLAHSLGLGVNAGHDLDRANLVRFRELPHLDEVSIGHALISEALFQGLPGAVRSYLEVLEGRST